MAAKRAVIPAKHLFSGFKQSVPQPWSNSARSMATEASPPLTTASRTHVDATASSISQSDRTGQDEVLRGASYLEVYNRAQPFQAQRNPFLTTTQCTLHSFPRFEPIRLITYPNTHLGVPLRKDILHRAVIFEGDNTRQGTASTKWRSEVHGSGRKIRPQKGTGHARLGDKKSPMLRGGGVAFGPKPRDFGTDLPLKVYDLAWRTALSYRYRQGELILVDGIAEIIDIHPDSLPRFTHDVLIQNRLGHDSGRTLFITRERRENLFKTLKSGNMGRHARALDVEDVDVKDLLEQGQLVVEQGALDWILKQHESDVDSSSKLGRWRFMQTQENAPTS